LTQNQLEVTKQLQAQTIPLKNKLSEVEDLNQQCVEAAIEDNE
jgi:hypothetical protein